MPWLVALLLFALCSLGPAAAWAEDEGEGEAEGAEPSGRSGKPKKVRRPGAPVFGLLPAIGFNQDDGIGLGVFGNVRWPAFDGEARRYRHDFGLNVKAWLKPGQIGWTGLFGFSWFPDPDGATEITFALTTWGRSWDWWFGVGQDTVRHRLLDPRDAPVRDWYHRFGHFRVRGDVHAFRSIAGPLDGLAGLAVMWNHTLVREGSLLHAQRHRLDGVDGGVTFSLDGGFRVDTRNDRVDPTRGGFFLALGQLSLGPERPWGRMLLDLRGWQGVADDWLVFGGELLLLGGVGPIPFYELGVLPGWELLERTAVGQYGLRGLDRGRLRGPLAALAHGEVRLRPPGFNLIPTFRVRFEPVLWADAVRVDSPPDLGGGWAVQPGFGGGFRIFWNEVSVSRFDIGTGPERIIDGQGSRVRWTVAIIGTVGQSF